MDPMFDALEEGTEASSAPLREAREQHQRREQEAAQQQQQRELEAGLLGIDVGQAPPQAELRGTLPAGPAAAAGGSEQGERGGVGAAAVGAGAAEATAGPEKVGGARLSPGPAALAGEEGAGWGRGGEEPAQGEEEECGEDVEAQMLAGEEAPEEVVGEDATAVVGVSAAVEGAGASAAVGVVAAGAAAEGGEAAAATAREEALPLGGVAEVGEPEAGEAGGAVGHDEAEAEVQELVEHPDEVRVAIERTHLGCALARPARRRRAPLSLRARRACRRWATACSSNRGARA